MDTFLQKATNILTGGENDQQQGNQRRDDNNNQNDNGGQGYGGHGGRGGQIRPEGDSDRRDNTADYSRDEGHRRRQEGGGDQYQGRDDNYGGASYDDNRNVRDERGGYSQQEALEGREYRGPQQGGGHGPGGYSSGGGGGYSDDDEDLRGAHSTAMQHADNNEDSGLFSQALGFIQGQKQGGLSHNVDEQDMIRAHQDAYKNDTSQDANGIGKAAALQALKMFTSGQSNAGPGGGGSGAFVGLAMSQAANLFNQKSSAGQVQSGDKQSAVNQAAMMAFKLYMQSQGKQGGSGAGGLMSMASKLLG